MLGAFKFTLEGRRVASARLAYGGMAATPKRAMRAEAAIAGASLDAPATWDAAIRALVHDFEPITDMRASAAYRMETAQALVHKALIEIAERGVADTRVVGLRAEAA